MSVTDDLLKNNEAYARSFSAGNLPLPPAKKLFVLACMDARLHVSRILGLQEGDAHVFRNAGGVATMDAIRSLTISQRLLGTEDVILIHHTDCGMLTQGRRGQRSNRGGYGHPAGLPTRGVLEPREGRAPVDRPDQGQPLHSPQGQDPWLRIRRQVGASERSRRGGRHGRQAVARATTPGPGAARSKAGSKRPVTSR